MAWTWTGAAGTDDWTNSSNWSGNMGTPSTAYDGTVNIGGPATIALDANQTISNLYITGGIVSITGADTLSIGSVLNLAAGATLSLGVGTQIGGSATVSITGAGTATISGGDFVNSNNKLSVSSGQDLVLSGGTSITASQINGAGTVTLNGATLQLTSGSSSAVIYFDSVAASGTPNIFKIPNYASGMTLNNIGYGDQIYANGDTLQLQANGDGTYKLVDTHGGNYTSTIASSVTLASGTNVNDFAMQNGSFVYTGSAPCFYAGTMIAVPGGTVAVEEIRSGDLVLTADGRALPVRWVGRSHVSARFGDPLRTLPIRIKAGALDEGSPARDLLVSPDHALFIDRILVQAGALVNGVSIIRESRVPEIFIYYHIELDDHELLLAEGAPAESFVDNVDRMNFNNWADHQALYPEGRAIREMSLPRVKSQRQLPSSIARALIERASLIGPDQRDVA